MIGLNVFLRNVAATGLALALLSPAAVWAQRGSPAPGGAPAAPAGSSRPANVQPTPAGAGGAGTGLPTGTTNQNLPSTLPAGGLPAPQIGGLSGTGNSTLPAGGLPSPQFSTPGTSPSTLPSGGFPGSPFFFGTGTLPNTMNGGFGTTLPGAASGTNNNINNNNLNNGQNTTGQTNPNLPAGTLNQLGATGGVNTTPLDLTNSTQGQPATTLPNIGNNFPSFPVTGGVAIINTTSGSTNAPAQGQQVPALTPMTSTTTATGIERPGPAVLDVRLPADAELYVQGQRVNQSGDLRRIVTPTLATGSIANVEIQAYWHRGNEELTTTEQILLRPGDYKGVTIIGGSPYPGSTPESRPNR